MQFNFRWNDSDWIEENKKILFFGIQKNASTSIRKYLNLNTRLNHKKLIDGEYESYKKIVVIREPIERFASGYLEIIYRAKKFRKHQARNKKFYKTPEFDKKIEYFIEECEKDFFDGHIRPQNTSLFFQLDITNGHIINFHNIENDLKKYNLIEENFEINILNKSKNNKYKEKILQLLKERSDLKNKLKVLYKKDFDIYNKMLRNEH